jgi:2-polyprenyl-3-methyl-5-hydroxy-6-metoxy-1,4-benzoquinol methylase
MRETDGRGGDDATGIIVDAMHRGARQAVPLVDRERYLLQLARQAGGRIGHIGCTDNPFTRERLESGTLLHERLVALGECEGIDVDRQGLELLEGRFPQHRFIHQDIAESVPEELRNRYALVIAGEVLEHVADAGAFLAACRLLLADGGHLCVTVPNALSVKNGLRAMAGYEVVHPDHFAYYSPRTLSRALAAQGLSPVFTATSLMAPPVRARALVALLRGWQRIRPGPVGEGVIVVARRVESRDR